MGKGFWSVTDQALFAGSNFLVSVLLARWLEPDAYGAVSFAYSLLLFWGTLQSGFLNEPMTVYGAGRFRDTFWSYKATLSVLNWRFGLLVALLFLVAGSVAYGAGSLMAALSLWGYGLAAPFILALWFERQVAYVLLLPQRSALGGVAYILTYFSVAIVLLATGHLNAFSAPVSMGVAAVTAAWIMARAYRGSSLPSKSRMQATLVYPLHWEYGRWAALTNVLGWVPGYLPFTLLPSLYGFDAVARMRALLNLVMPIWHFNGALSRLLVPAFVRALSRGEGAQMLWKAFFPLVSFAVIYWTFLVFYGELAMRALYGGKYDGDAHLLTWLGLTPVLGAAVAVLGAHLRAWGNSKAVAKAYTFSLGLGIPAIVVLTWSFGVGGSVIAILLIEVLNALFLSRVGGSGSR